MSKLLEPDYPDYSLEELQDALAHINRDRYPERVERILREIELRRAQPAPEPEPTPSVANPGPRRRRRRIVVGVGVVGGVALLAVAVAVVPRLLSIAREASAIHTALAETYPDQSVRVEAEQSDRTLTLILADSAQATLEEEAGEKWAREFATVALGAATMTWENVVVQFARGEETPDDPPLPVYRFEAAALTTEAATP